MGIALISGATLWRRCIILNDLGTLVDKRRGPEQDRTNTKDTFFQRHRQQ